MAWIYCIWACISCTLFSSTRLSSSIYAFERLRLADYYIPQYFMNFIELKNWLMYLPWRDYWRYPSRSKWTRTSWGFRRFTDPSERSCCSSLPPLCSSVLSTSRPIMQRAFLWLSRLRLRRNRGGASQFLSTRTEDITSLLDMIEPILPCAQYLSLCNVEPSKPWRPHRRSWSVFCLPNPLNGTQSLPVFCRGSSGIPSVGICRSEWIKTWVKCRLPLTSLLLLILLPRY